MIRVVVAITVWVPPLSPSVQFTCVWPWSSVVVDVALSFAVGSEAVHVIGTPATGRSFGSRTLTTSAAGAAAGAFTTFCASPETSNSFAGADNSGGVDSFVQAAI